MSLEGNTSLPSLLRADHEVVDAYQGIEGQIWGAEELLGCGFPM